MSWVVVDGLGKGERGKEGKGKRGEGGEVLMIFVVLIMHELAGG